MSAPWTCPRCGYKTRFGNSATIQLHHTVSHGTGSPVIGDGHSHKGYVLRCTMTGAWVIPSLSTTTYPSAEAAIGAIDAAGLDARP